MDHINSRAILEGINHPKLILNVSNEIVAANQTFQVRSGMNEEEMKGLKCFKLVHGSECSATPENCPMKMIINGERREPVEKVMKTVNGYSLISCTPIFDNNGTLQRIMHLITEVNEVNAKFPTHDTHHEFLENPMIPVFTSNLNGDILFANNTMANMFGFVNVEDLKNNKTTVLYKNLEDRKQLIGELLKKKSFKWL